MTKLLLKDLKFRIVKDVIQLNFNDDIKQLYYDGVHRLKLYIVFGNKFPQIAQYII